MIAAVMVINQIMTISMAVIVSPPWNLNLPRGPTYPETSMGLYVLQHKVTLSDPPVVKA